MRFITLVIATFAVAISANASAIEKRKLTENYKTCTSSINYGLKAFKTIKFKVNKLAPLGDDLTDKMHINLPSYILRSTSYCCQKAAPGMNAEDIKAVPAFLLSLFNEYDSLVSFLVSNQMRLEEIEELAVWAYDVVSAAERRLKELFTCLNPNDKTFLVKLDDAFSKLKEPTDA